MKYQCINGEPVTPCKFYPEKFVGGFGCLMCPHYRSYARHVSGVRSGQPGESHWTVGCGREKKALDKSDK